ncbi:DUF2934 domain-containing protein [Oceaniglobus roseus]|uniref:DUF2934 domain-containing protein n=1 Tax=Oceaniglobus roseus TaxID=1737570 RepID=UPI000C7ED61F|nr:DUF2934 domain-containing protein [Kandeliimicrobium roseum]
MEDGNHERIAQRAHDIWEREGRPEGKHDEHWQRAANEVKAEEISEADPSSENGPPPGGPIAGNLDDPAERAGGKGSAPSPRRKG